MEIPKSAKYALTPMLSHCGITLLYRDQGFETNTDKKL